MRIRRGEASRLLAETLPPRGDPLPAPNGALHIAELRRVEPLPAESSPQAGLVPLGALAEAGGPAYAWPLSERDRLWADQLASLTERAARAQWDATLDIPWEAAAGLPSHTEQAVAQVMTYIAQNEYAALYVPARFLPQVNPRYTEVLLWLASHVHDEARHVEVFTKRALAGGARAHALASTDLSLHSLLDESDFSAAALLLNVLGEGTFLDLLRFVERHAPDAATAAAARLAHRDERRHVQFGIAHVRRRLALDPEERHALVAAAEARAAKLTSLSGLSPLVTESLILMATPLAPARRPLRSRRRAAPAAAGDGAEPHTAPARRRLRCADRSPSLGPAHTEPHVNRPAVGAAGSRHSRPRVVPMFGPSRRRRPRTRVTDPHAGQGGRNAHRPRLAARKRTAQAQGRHGCGADGIVGGADPDGA